MAKRIVIDAYGNGAKPVLAASTQLRNWVSTGRNLWRAYCPECGTKVTGVYHDGTALPLGRYPNPDAPNKGYLTVKFARWSLPANQRAAVIAELGRSGSCPFPNLLDN